MTFLLLFIETLLWHSMVLLIHLMSGLDARFAVIVGVVLVNSAVFTVWERRTGPAGWPRDRSRSKASRIALAILGGYVLIARAYCLIHHSPAMYVAARIHSWAFLAASAAAALLPFFGRVWWVGRPAPRLTRAGTIVLLAGWLINGSFYYTDLGASCGRIASQMGVRPILLLVPCRQFAGWEKMLDGGLTDIWEIAVGLGDGKAYVSAGPDRGGAERSRPVRALSRIDLADPSRRVAVRELSSDGIGFDPSTDTLFFGSFAGMRIVAMERSTFKITDRVGLPVKPVTLVLDPARNRLLAPGGSPGSGSLFAIDLATHSVSGGHPFSLPIKDLVGLSPCRIAVNRAGGRIYASNFTPDIVLVEYDYETLEPLRVGRWFVPSRGVVFDEKRNRIYLSIAFAGRIDVIEPEGLTRVGEIHGGFGIRDLVLDSERDVLYVGNFLTGEVSALALPDGERLLGYQVGKKVRGLALDGPAEKLYAVSGTGAFEMDLAPLDARRPRVPRP